MKRRHLTYQMEHHILLNGSFPKTCDVVATNVDLLSLTGDDYVGQIDVDINLACPFGGRPKGSTNHAKENYTNVLKKATTDATIMYQQEKLSAEIEKN
jgi:hypothetical protein